MIGNERRRRNGSWTYLRVAPLSLAVGVVFGGLGLWGGRHLGLAIVLLLAVTTGLATLTSP